MRWRIVLLFAVLVLVLGTGLLWWAFPRSTLSLGAFLSEKGELDRIELRERVARNGVVFEEILLTSTSGLHLVCRVQSPAKRRDPVPACLLLGGMRTGRMAVSRIPQKTSPLVWLSFDYPYQLPERFPKPWELFGALQSMAGGAKQTLGGMLLALDYLEARSDVDTNRTLVAGGSLGSFFAVIAGSLEPRFDAVVVLNGGGELDHLVAENLPWKSGLVRKTVSKALRPWLSEFEPTRYAGGIAPRPFLMINAREDRRIPRDCVLALYQAAEEPKELVWMDTTHQLQDKPDDVAQVAATVVDWLGDQGWIPKPVASEQGDTDAGE